MIDIIDFDDINDIKKTNDKKEEVLTNLKDENNVSFDGEKVCFPEVKFTNVQEALNYVKKQKNMLLAKNREKNEGVVNEISGFLDMLINNGNTYGGITFEIEEIKSFLQNYQGDLSNFINEVINDRETKIVGDTFYTNKGHQSKIKKLEGEDLIKAFKENALDYLIKYKSDQASLYYVTSSYFYSIKDIFLKYKNNQVK